MAEKAERVARAVNSALVPGWVQKVWQDEQERVFLRLRVRQDNFLLLLSAVPGRSGLGTVEARGQSSSRPKALLSYLRAHLEGGSLLSASASGGRSLLLLTFGARSRQLSLVLDLCEKSPAILALDPEGTIRASTTRSKGGAGPKHGERFPFLEEFTSPQASEGEESLEFLKKEGERLLSLEVPDSAVAEASHKKREKKLQKKIANIRADLARAGEAEELRKKGDLLAASLRLVKKGMESVEVEGEGGSKETITLDPSRTPGENLELLYKKASKAKRARKIAGERLAAAIEELENPPPEEAKSSPRPALKGGSRPFLRYRSSENFVILAGRNGPENMRLLRESRPWDLWLHARDGAGAHVVIVKPGKESKVPERTLVEAAGVAALRSRLSSQGSVDVMYAEVSRVHRVKGASPGKVLVSGEKTIRVPPGAGAPRLVES